jgi:hypothetical protein
MVKYGKTWYETKFGAKPEIKSERKQIDDTLRFLREAPKLPLDEFYNTYIDSRCRMKNFKKFIEADYNASKSYYEFLYNMIQNNDCAVLQEWFQYFMSKHCNFIFEEALWIIKPSDWFDVLVEETQEKHKFKSIHQGGYSGGNPSDFKR